MVLKPFERLPKTVIPIHYDISIKPDLVRLVFQGKESVTIKVICSLKHCIWFFIVTYYNPTGSRASGQDCAQFHGSSTL